MLTRCLLMAAGLFLSPAFADGVAWEKLSAEQQQVLVSARAGWNQLPPLRQDTLARGAQRWLEMPPEQRTQARERLTRWQQMPAAARAQALREREKFRALPPAERARIVEGRERFENMPEAEQQDARSRFEAMKRTRARLRCALAGPSQASSMDCARLDDPQSKARP